MELISNNMEIMNSERNSIVPSFLDECTGPDASSENKLE